jgi:hypothetical protein
MLLPCGASTSASRLHHPQRLDKANPPSKVND